MANFYKIAKFVAEYESTDTSDVHVYTINPVDLEMAATDVADTGIAAYHIKVIVLRTYTGFLSHTGASEFVSSMSYAPGATAGSKTLAVPTYASQPASIRTLDGLSAYDLDVRITGRNSEDANALDDFINIILREPAANSALPARYKMFITVTAHGQDVA